MICNAEIERGAPMSTGHSAKETNPTCIITMVHGTWPVGIRGTIRGILHAICPKLFSAAPPLWFHEGSVFRSRLESELRKENTVATFRPFRWSGANSVFHRARAADKLHRMLASDPDNANSIVIAHSHGGNVAFQAISKLGSRGATIHLITLATPFLQVFPTWSGPGFWFFLFIFVVPIYQLLGRIFQLLPLPHDSTALTNLVILVVFASIPSALLAYFVINPTPPEAKRQLALQNKTWASRPFTIAKKTNYDSAGPDAPNLLVIRGVDDEAALAFASGAIATRINHLTLGVLWKVALLLTLVPLLLEVLLGVVGAAVLAGIGLDLVTGGGPIDKAFDTLNTLSKQGREYQATYQALVLAGIAILVAVPVLFNGMRFGREFLIGATRCEVATDSAPDSTRSRIVTLQTPYYQLVPWLKQAPRSMHHAIYNYPDCVPAIVKWINEHVR
jgi:hypothetical protein